jgi:RNA polymerase sigma-70 factor (ECF subfamily)
MFFKLKLETLTDHDLISRISKGDEGAFAEILKRYQKCVYRFAYQFLGDEIEAFDIAQESFLRVYELSSNFHPKGSVRFLIMRITKNLCIDFVRRKKPVFTDSPPDITNGETSCTALLQKEVSNILATAIQELPENQKTAVLLRHMEEMNYAEIAEVMDTSIGAVESLLVRARKKLKKRMDTGVYL